VAELLICIELLRAALKLKVGDLKLKVIASSVRWALLRVGLVVLTASVPLAAEVSVVTLLLSSFLHDASISNPMLLIASNFVNNLFMSCFGF
jgi:hypothetical protein